MSIRGERPPAVKNEDAVDLKKAGISTDAKSSPVPPIICYCLASILMTLVNKFVVSGANFSMTFLLLCIQSTVCVGCVAFVKTLGLISFRAFDVEDAKTWLPISSLLVSVIYTGSKSLQFLSIPVYTIFKNLTIILIAYGEVFWFGGRVTTLTFIAFIFMVLSSIIAAWSDLTNAFPDSISVIDSATNINLQAIQGSLQGLGVGYIWMFCNCVTSAAYVLTMRKKIKATGFSDWDSMFYNNLLSIPILAVFSFIIEDWGSENLSRNLLVYIFLFAAVAETASNSPHETRNFLLFAICFSGAAAVGISYTTAWCVRTTSSTTYSMVGALNKLPVAASGMLFFGDPATFGSISSIFMGFFAGVLYAVAKNNQKWAENREQTDTILPLSARMAVHIRRTFG